MTGVVLQTQPDCPPGLLHGWAREHGWALEVIDVRAEEPPDPREFAFAVALGSDASVAEGDEPWIAREVEWLRAADAACLPVLGICFGAHALAAALGGRALRLAQPEIGWVAVDSCDPERVPPGPWLAWHEDAIDLPPLAYEVARNAFGVQAFCHCRHLAVQFHPEVTEEIVAGWGNSSDDLRRAGLERAQLASETVRHAPAAAAAARRLFDGFAARAGLAALVQAPGHTTGSGGSRPRLAAPGGRTRATSMLAPTGHRQTRPVPPPGDPPYAR